MNRYKKRELKIKVDELPFQNLFSTQYSMTVRVNAQKTYEYSKRNNMSFFNITSACILEAINEIPEFKRRIIDGKVYEYEKINAITPLIMEDNSLRVLEILPVSEHESIREYNKYLECKKNNIEKYQFMEDPSMSDVLPICSFSCIPWINFDSMSNIMSSANQLMPVITWGKLASGKISLSVAASYMFMSQYHFQLLYEKIGGYLKNPELMEEE